MEDYPEELRITPTPVVGLVGSSSTISVPNSANAVSIESLFRQSILPLQQQQQQQQISQPSSSSSSPSLQTLSATSTQSSQSTSSLLAPQLSSVQQKLIPRMKILQMEVKLRIFVCLTCFARWETYLHEKIKDHLTMHTMHKEY